jgi:hypothetical protein
MQKMLKYSSQMLVMVMQVVRPCSAGRTELTVVVVNQVKHDKENGFILMVLWLYSLFLMMISTGIEGLV